MKNLSIKENKKISYANSLELITLRKEINKCPEHLKTEWRKKHFQKLIQELKSKNKALTVRTNYVNKIRHYPPTSQEWSNSIYQYNKKNEKFFLSSNNYLLKLIENIYSLSDKDLNKEINILKLRPWQKKVFSNNKILLNSPQLKHLNDKIIINLFLYNRDKLYYLEKLNNLSIKNFISKKISLEEAQLENLSEREQKNLFSLVINKSEEKNSFYFFNEIVFRKFKKNFFYKEITSNSFLSEINERFSLFLKNIAFTNENYLDFLKTYLNFKNNLRDEFTKEMNLNLEKNKKNFSPKLKNNLRKRFSLYFLFIEKILFRREMLYLTLKKSLLLDSFKTNDIILLPLRRALFKIYKKKIIFNLINLKRPYFNGKILKDILISKIDGRSMHARLAVKALLGNIKVPFTNRLDYFKKKRDVSSLQIIKLNSKLNCFKKDLLTNFLENKFFFILKDDKEIKESSNYTELSVLNNLKNKNIYGIKLELSGRLTRRIIAERARKFILFKGTIKNTDSSYRKYPNVLLKGNLISNLDHFKGYSKTRIGAYGIKGWVSTI